MILLTIATSPAFAADSDLQLFNQLKQAGVGVDEYTDPSQTNVVVAPLLCTVNLGTKNYACRFSDLSFSPVSSDPLQMSAQGGLAADLYQLLVNAGLKPSTFPAGLIVEATEITCIQITDTSDTRTLSERTTCDITK